MTIRVNGADREVREAQTVRDLVRELGLPDKALLIEHNGLALRPEEWDDRTLAEADRVEFVRVVAGG